MSVDFGQIFKNRDKYPDNFKFKMGEEEIELGVLRAYNEQENGALVKSLKEQQAAVTAQLEKNNRAADEIATLYVAVQEEKTKLGTQRNNQQQTDPYAELEADPLVGSLAKLMRQQAAETARNQQAINEKLGLLEKNQSQIGITYLNERANADFRSLESDPDFKDSGVTVNQLYQDAVKSGLKDANGIPDVRAAYRQATATKREARLIAEAEKRGAEKFQEDQKMQNLLPKPGFGPRTAGGPEAPNYKDINGALSAAMKDPGIWTGNA
jgi:hypothetical protein